MIDHIDACAGRREQLKIEGRAKSAYYVSQRQTHTARLWIYIRIIQRTLNCLNGFMTKYSRSVTGLIARDFSLVTLRIVNIMKTAVI